MAGAGLTVESAKGECNPGQHEIAFRYDDALVTCDQHAVYKTGAKEIAAQEGISLTFMAKYNEREGNSCHIHLSLADADGDQRHGRRPADGGMSEVMRHFLAGQLAALRDFSLLYAPNINSYKRFQPGSFAPTAVAWGHDNRTCALRVVGHGRSLRFENRLPGGDVNPYLAVAGLVAAGLYGIEHELELPEACAGNAYTADYEHVPTTLREAAELWENSPHRQGRLRRRGRRPLPQHGARRAGRLRRRRHRLGAAPLLRTHVRPFCVFRARYWKY